MLTAEEVVVVLEEPGAPGELECPGSHRLVPADLGLERPPIRANVDEPARIVLARRDDDGHARTERSRVPALRELGTLLCGTAEQIHRETHARISETRPRDLPAR